MDGVHLLYYTFSQSVYSISFSSCLSDTSLPVIGANKYTCFPLTETVLKSAQKGTRISNLRSSHFKHDKERKKTVRLDIDANFCSPDNIYLIFFGITAESKRIVPESEQLAMNCKRRDWITRQCFIAFLCQMARSEFWHTYSSIRFPEQNHTVHSASWWHCELWKALNVQGFDEEASQDKKGWNINQFF